MSPTPDLPARYRAYLDCLDTRDWSRLSDHVQADVSHNDRPFGLPVHGRRVVFHEHVFYRYRDGRIAAVHSLIDREAILAQLDPPAR